MIEKVVLIIYCDSQCGNVFSTHFGSKFNPNRGSFLVFDTYYPSFSFKGADDGCLNKAEKQQRLANGISRDVSICLLKIPTSPMLVIYNLHNNDNDNEGRRAYVCA